MVTQRIEKLCAYCRSPRVSWDATETWDVDSQSFVHADTCDVAYCEDCGGETSVVDLEIAQ